MNPTTILGDRPISRMGFGAMQLAGPGVFGPPRDPDAARAVLRRAIELGVDHIDTSQYYGPDVVNDLIREALYPYPDSLRLVTKVGARRDDAGRVHPAQQPGELRRGVEENLRSLRLERLDLVNLRLVGTRDGSGTLFEEQLGALEELRQEGKLDLIGLSNVDRAQVQRALAVVEVAEIQNLYSIVDRRDEETLVFAREREIAYVPFLPLGGGPARLAGSPAVLEVADKHRATPAQIALASLLARYDRMLLIPGTSSTAHLEETAISPPLIATPRALKHRPGRAAARDNHQIPAAPAHRGAGQHDCVPRLPCLYMLRIKGRVGPTALSAFPSMVSQVDGSDTVLTGLLPDQSALFGAIATIEALGLELLELREIRA